MMAETEDGIWKDGPASGENRPHLGTLEPSKSAAVSIQLRKRAISAGLKEFRRVRTEGKGECLSLGCPFSHIFTR